MRLLEWTTDPATLYWAVRAPLSLPSAPRPQFETSGQHHSPAVWRKHIRREFFASFALSPDRDYLLSNPKNIIRSFKTGDMLHALVLTVIWGTMTRTKNRIYTRGLPKIEKTLRETIAQVDREETARGAWERLVKDLHWTPVICSKFLHFGARSLGFEFNPPVPIDNAVFAQKVWPAFRKKIARTRRPGDPSTPSPWLAAESGWAGYNRYMTAVTVWAAAKGWTTTQVENTLYDLYTKAT